MKFSIIIPCANSHKTIGRVMDSIVAQNLDRTMVEVIICNDKNDDNYLSIVNQYKKYFKIDIVDVPGNYHCPGNSRQAGLDRATGDWVTFIDHDDMFEPDSFQYVIRYISERQTDGPCISTIFTQCNFEKNTMYEIKHAMSFLHGKFYNREFLRKNAIRFKTGMMAFEDIYFNNCVLNALYRRNIEEVEFFDIYTYRWIENEESISRDNTRRGYLHDNFNDYITAASEPFITRQSDYCLHQLVVTFVRAYFYYEAASYKNGAENYLDNLEVIKDYCDILKHDHGFTARSLSNYVKGIRDIVDYIQAEIINMEGEFEPVDDIYTFIDMMFIDEQ